MAATETQDHQLFLEWERNEVPSPPGFTDIALHRSIRRRWDNLRNKPEYIEILRAMAASMARARPIHTAFLRRQRQLRSSQNEDTFAMYCAKQDRLYDNVYASLENKLNHKRQLQCELLSLEYAQQECLDRAGSWEHTRALIKRTCGEIQDLKNQITAFEEEKGKYLHWDHDSADKKRKADEMEDMETRGRKKATRQAGGKVEPFQSLPNEGRKRARTQKTAAAGGQPGGGGDDGSDDEKRPSRKVPKDKADVPRGGKRRDDWEKEEEEESTPGGRVSEGGQDAAAPEQQDVEQQGSNTEAPALRAKEDEREPTPEGRMSDGGQDAATPEQEHTEQQNGNAAVLASNGANQQTGGTAGGAGDPNGDGDDDSSDDDDEKDNRVPTPTSSDDKESDDEDEEENGEHTPAASDEEHEHNDEDGQENERNHASRETAEDEQDDNVLDDDNIEQDDTELINEHEQLASAPVVPSGQYDTRSPGFEEVERRDEDDYEDATLDVSTPDGAEKESEPNFDRLSDERPAGTSNALKPTTVNIKVRLSKTWDKMSSNEQAKHIRGDWDHAAKLFRSKGVGAEMKAAFRDLHMWCEHLLIPPLDPWTPLYTEFETLEEYLASLEDVVHRGAGRCHKRWEEFAAADVDEAASGWQFAGVPQGTIDDASDDQHDQSTANEVVAPGIYCGRAWAIVQRKLLASNPTPNDRWRLEVRRREAEQDMQLHQQYWFPPLWPEDTSAGDYLTNLTAFTRNVRSILLEDAWDFAIKNASTLDDVRELGEDKEEAVRQFRQSGTYWHPSYPLASPVIDVEDPEGFDSDRTGIEGTWNALGELGSGGFGKATLWVKFDAFGRPIDKTVIKSVYLGHRTGANSWDSPKHWRTDISDRLPLEYEFPRTLDRLPESFNIIEARSYATYEVKKAYTVYLEYCPRGTLGDLVRRYQQAPALVDENGIPTQKRIPVRVLWSIFEALASAVCLMHDGCLPGGTAPRKRDFSKFMHRDIKPENIFLAEPDTTFWPQVPVAKMGDFGLSILIDGEEGITKDGTENWAAPEMAEYDTEDIEVFGPEDYTYHYAPDPRSDIWTVGRVMQSLMNLEDPIDIPPRRFDQYYDGLARPYSNPLDRESAVNDEPYYDGVEDFYPRNLLDLVERCATLYPEDRYKTASELWEAVHASVAAARGLRGRPLREMPRGCLGQELLLMEPVGPGNHTSMRWAT